MPSVNHENYEDSYTALSQIATLTITPRGRVAKKANYKVLWRPRTRRTAQPIHRTKLESSGEYDFRPDAIGTLGHMPEQREEYYEDKLARGGFKLRVGQYPAAHVQLGSIDISRELGHADNQHLAPWQLVFLIRAIATFTGIVAFVYILSSPVDWKLFNEEGNSSYRSGDWRSIRRASGTARSCPNYQTREALLDPRVYFILGSSYPSASSARTVLWEVPNGVFPLLYTLVAGFVASKSKSMSIIMIPVVQMPSTRIFGIATIDLHHRLALTCWLLNVTGAAIILHWLVIAFSFAVHTRRMTYRRALHVQLCGTQREHLAI
ncbi:hypothetical protein LX36DRAFT_676356 [Colletotrichum falcatum]|nr:hypothetical protein LX36DRAFT_676356 [Colletotrichum falcatum]